MSDAIDRQEYIPIASQVEVALSVFRAAYNRTDTQPLPRAKQEFILAKMRKDAVEQAKRELLRDNVREKKGFILRSISHRYSLQVFANRIVCHHSRQKKQPHSRTMPVDKTIHGFSKASRKRMTDGLAEWRNLTGKAFFITLTYHEEWGEHFSAWKRDLDVFIKRMRRKFPDVGGIWKLEFQRRGAPHFHLIICSDSLTTRENLIEWVTEAWGEIAHENSIYKGEFSTNVRKINSHRHAMHYASKYMSKEVPQRVSEETGEILGEIATGRCWAFFGDVDRSPVLELQLNESLARAMFKAAAETLSNRNSRYATRFAQRSDMATWSAYGVGRNEIMIDTLPIEDFIGLAWDIKLGINGY